jgi:3-deoxy-D-manno-octulosonic-acid transferase
VMVRYDIWPNHIWALQRKGIPILIANATMRLQTKRRLPFVKNFHHHVYNAIDKILTVSTHDAEAFGVFSLDHPRVESIGDTRYDQVSLRSAEAKRRHIISEEIVKGKIVLIAGSTWPEDEQVLLPALLKLQKEIPNVLAIIVPHEPTMAHLEELEDQLDGETTFIRFSGLNEYRNERIIIVDSIGILLTLYTYAHVAYVGGSFRQGVHNVLEAAVYGIPVLFGPRHRNSQEPMMLAGQGGGFVVTDTKTMYRTMRNLLENDSARKTAGAHAEQFVRAHTGATERFLNQLEPYLRDQRKSA